MKKTVRTRKSIHIDDLPNHRRIPGTSYVIDCFNINVEGASKYFLTHFHADHYYGLNKSSSQGKTIYMTRTTRNLSHMKLRVSLTNMIVLEFYEWFQLDEDIFVFTIDANHCPGACCFIFQVKNNLYLHTGDFRCSEEWYTQSEKFYRFFKSKSKVTLEVDRSPPQIQSIYSQPEDVKTRNSEISSVHPEKGTAIWSNLPIICNQCYDITCNVIEIISKGVDDRLRCIFNILSQTEGIHTTNDDKRNTFFLADPLFSSRFLETFGVRQKAHPPTHKHVLELLWGLVYLYILFHIHGNISTNEKTNGCLCGNVIEKTIVPLILHQINTQNRSVGELSHIENIIQQISDLFSLLKIPDQKTSNSHGGFSTRGIRIDVPFPEIRQDDSENTVFLHQKIFSGIKAARIGTESKTKSVHHHKKQHEFLKDTDPGLKLGSKVLMKRKNRIKSTDGISTKRSHTKSRCKENTELKCSILRYCSPQGRSNQSEIYPSRDETINFTVKSQRNCRFLSKSILTLIYRVLEYAFLRPHRLPQNGNNAPNTYLESADIQKNSCLYTRQNVYIHCLYQVCAHSQLILQCTESGYPHCVQTGSLLQYCLLINDMIFKEIMLQTFCPEILVGCLELFCIEKTEIMALRFAIKYRRFCPKIQSRGVPSERNVMIMFRPQGLLHMYTYTCTNLMILCEIIGIGIEFILDASQPFTRFHCINHKKFIKENSTHGPKIQLAIFLPSIVLKMLGQVVENRCLFEITKPSQSHFDIESGRWLHGRSSNLVFFTMSTGYRTVLKFNLDMAKAIFLVYSDSRTKVRLKITNQENYRPNVPGFQLKLTRVPLAVEFKVKLRDLSCLGEPDFLKYTDWQSISLYRSCDDVSSYYPCLKMTHCKNPQSNGDRFFKPTGDGFQMGRDTTYRSNRIDQSPKKAKICNFLHDSPKATLVPEGTIAILPEKAKSPCGKNIDRNPIGQPHQLSHLIFRSCGQNHSIESTPKAYKCDPHICDLRCIRFDQIFLDNTYFGFKHFDDQKSNIGRIIEHLDKYINNASLICPRKPILLFSTYCVGKERVFFSVAKFFNYLIHVSKEKMAVYSCFDQYSRAKLENDVDTILSSLTLRTPRDKFRWLDQSGRNRPPEPRNLFERFCDDRNKCNMFLIPQMYVNPQGIHKVIEGLETQRVFVFVGSGWNDKKTTHRLKSSTGKNIQSGIEIIYFPYSEHSSSTELKIFKQTMNYDKIINTVNYRDIEHKKSL